jgi:glucose-1-phosphate adenylyltransferase
MLNQHKKSGAVCTIATITVPLEEASRFGICNTYSDGEIYEFEEKPKYPKCDQASMGIYVFNTETLIKYLEIDEADERSSNDFGKNVIPNLLASGEKVYSYKFTGYWKDVGTIQSLWEANMDMLSPHTGLDLNDEAWRIYYRNPASPPHYIAPEATVNHSTVTEGCEVFGSVEHSVLSTGCVIGKGAEIRDSVIMPNVTIENGASVCCAIVAEGCHIKAGAKVGRCCEGERKIAVIGKDPEIAEGAVIEPGAIV